jgi:hypothetical protein
MDGEDIESQGKFSPLLFALKKELRGEDDFAALRRRDGRQSTAEFNALPLPDFDDGQYAGVETDEVDLTGSAALIACQNFQPADAQIFRGKRLAGRAALQVHSVHAA